MGQSAEKRRSIERTSLPLLIARDSDEETGTMSPIPAGYLDRLVLDESIRPSRSGVFRSWLSRTDEQSNERLLPFFSSRVDGSSPIMGNRANVWQQRKQQAIAFASVHWKTILICVLVVLLILDIIDD